MYLTLAFLFPLALASAPYLNSTSKTPVSGHVAIERTLAKWPSAVNSKNYTLLSDLFTPNATLELQLPSGPVSGLAAIQNWLNDSLVNTSTQHDLGTQHISIFGQSAYATTYFVATSAGVGEQNGSALVNHAKYLDTLVRNGTDGEWRISNKTLIYMVSFSPVWRECP